MLIRILVPQKDGGGTIHRESGMTCVSSIVHISINRRISCRPFTTIGLKKPKKKFWFGGPGEI